MASAPAPGTKVETIYVATTRARKITEADVFTAGRARQVNYAEFKISIPPGHQPGQIEWPKGPPDPATSFAAVQQGPLDGTTFEQKIAFREHREDRRAAVVFVHGYNTSFQEALFRFAQMTADTDVGDAPILFSWPSEARVTGYVADKDAVLYSRDQLVELLTMLAQKPGVGKITVIGHSMGCWLTMEAVRQLRLTGKTAVLNRLHVILAAPDIDVDVFRAEMQVVGPMAQPMTLLVSRGDVALAVSRRLAGDRQRVGALDVDDPRVQEAALKAKLQIIDISSLKGTDSLNHDRFVSLAALYPRIAAAEANGTGPDLRHTGAFVFNSVGMTLASPFNMAGSALAGE
ncbi:MAG: alpha/beta hydrolase [Methylovirgula sp.]